MKRVLIFLIFCLAFPFGVYAEDYNAESFYKEQYDLSGTDELYDALPDYTKNYLDDNELNPENPDWVNNLDAENVFLHIFSFIKSGAKKPIASGLSILAIILISACVTSMEINQSVLSAALFATVLSVASVISAPLFSVISSGVNAMQGCAVFMLSFIPVFAAIVASSGKVLTSVSMSTLLLGASQVVSYISNFVVIPLLCGFLSVSIASSVSPILERSGIADGIKKTAFWIMSLLTTVFVGILSIQTAVNASADTLGLKTAKFIVGSSVPVAGTVLSEALTTVTASMGLLKSSVGIYGVVVCALIFLPIIAELFIWKIMLVLNSVVSELFSLSKITGLLKSIETVVSVMIGIIILTAAMFIISLSVVVSAGKA